MKGGKIEMSSDNSVKITAMIIIGVLIVFLAGAYIYSESSPAKETIQSTGYSTIKVVPDTVSIYFNVQTNGTTAKEAKDANEVIVDAMTSVLIEKGIEKNKIETMNLNVYEDFDWTYSSYSPKKISKGFVATHSIRVVLPTNSSDKIGDVLDGGIDSGAMLSYINFELSQPLENQYKAQALKLAAEDAKVKAESTASGVGAKLGKVVSVSTSDFRYTPWMAYDNSGGAMVKAEEVSSSIQPSEHEINAQVTVVYKLK
jgi:uncharacterized protein YggE